MDWVAANGGTTTFTQVQRFIVEEIKGWKYSHDDRGYYVSAFTSKGTGRSQHRPLGYFRKPGKEKRYLEKQSNGKYLLITPAN
jgi:hypothetical protein